MPLISRKVVWSLILAGSVCAPVLVMAADYSPPLAGRAVPYSPPLQDRWNGLYVGLNGGGAFGSSLWALSGNNFDTSGWMIGATVGYNMRVAGFVLGMEGDFGYARVNGSTTLGGCAAGCSLKHDYLSTARARVGIAMDRFLPYATGGLAVGRVVATQGGLGSQSAWRYGYAIGAGLEMEAMSSVTVKGEYLFVDLGSYSCTPVCGVAPTNSLSYYTNVWRLGLNYQF